MATPPTYGLDQLDDILNPVISGSVLSEMNQFKTGMNLANQMGALEAQQGTNYARELQSQKLLDMLGAETDRAGLPGADPFSPEAQAARRATLGKDLASNQELFEKQKNAAVAQSEASAVRANAEAENTKALTDARKKLIEAQTALTEAKSRQDPTAIQAAALALRTAQFQWQQHMGEENLALRQAGEGRRATQGAIMTWVSAQRLLNPNPTGAMTKAVRDAEGVQSAIDNVRQLSEAADAGMPATGPLGYGATNQFLSQFGAGAADPEFYAALQGLRRQVQVATAGLQVPKHEMSDILTELAGIETAPYGRAARLDQLELKMARLIDKYGKGGVVNPNLRGIQMPAIPGLPAGFGSPVGGSASETPSGGGMTPGGSSTGKSPSRLIKYQGRLVPFSSLPPEVQALVVQHGG